MSQVLKQDKNLSISQSLQFTTGDKILLAKDIENSRFGLPNIQNSRFENSRLGLPNIENSRFGFPNIEIPRFRLPNI